MPPEKNPHNPNPGGRPKTCIVPEKDLDALVEQCAEATIRGESLRYAKKGPPLGDMMQDDRKALQKAIGINAEELTARVDRSIERFNERFSAKLAELEEIIADRIKETVQNKEMPATGLAFALGVVATNRARLDGRNMINNAAVNISITSYCGSDPNFDREKLLAALDPRSRRMSIQAAGPMPPTVNVTPEEAA